jgi:hypothetical protein
LVLALATAGAITATVQSSVAHASTVGGPITRAEVMKRAQYWYSIRLRPSLNHYDLHRNDLEDDGDGHRYGQDCSGFVSMAWHLPPSGGGPSTADLDRYATRISKGDLKPGDILLKPKVGDRSGHVVLFESWRSDRTHDEAQFRRFQP